MARNNGHDLTVARMATVLIPVVVGTLLGLIASLTTTYVTFQAEREERLSKEHAAHRERAMTLTLQYANDVARALSVGLITEGDVTSKDLAILSAPTETLLQLSVVISLYFPKLQSEVEQIHVAHGTMMQRFDEIIGARGQHRGEDAATFSQRIQKETAPTMERIRSLKEKLGDPAMQKRSNLAYRQDA